MKVHQQVYFVIFCDQFDQPKPRLQAVLIGVTSIFQARDAEIGRLMAEESRRADEEQKRKLEERIAEGIRYQQELEKQLEEQERRKQEAYEEFLKEKLMIDEIVRKIHEEDARYFEKCFLSLKDCGST